MADATPRFEFVREGGYERPLPSLGAGVLHVLLWCVVFLAVAAAVRAVLPLSPESNSTRKLEHFLAHKDDYDVLFLGSSQVYRHIEPERFDRAMAEAGYPVASFNFGVAGMAALESRALLERILAAEPARLRWVFTDVQRTGVRLTGDNHLTARVASWHDPRTTRMALDVIWQAHPGLAWKFDMTVRHLMALSSWLSNAGRLRQLVEPHLGGTAATREAARPDRFDAGPGGLGPRADGWVPLELAFTHATVYDKALIRERVEAWTSTREEHLAALRDLADERRPIMSYTGEARRPQELLPGERALLTDLLDQGRAAGVELVFINAPDVRQREFLLEAALAEGVIPNLLDLDDLQRYPQLLRPDLRYDLTHLNQKGAGLYTTALAREFARWLQAQGVAPEAVGGIDGR